MLAGAGIVKVIEESLAKPHSWERKNDASFLLYPLLQASLATAKWPLDHFAERIAELEQEITQDSKIQCQ